MSVRLGDLPRLWRTVRPLGRDQLWHRVRLAARRRWWAARPAPVEARYRSRAAGGRVHWAHPGLVSVARARLARRAAHAPASVADDALAGRFTLLGETRELGRPVAWERPDLAQALLWKTHLHEFGYALELAQAAVEGGSARHREGFFALAREWSEAEPIGAPGFHLVPWNERVVATRLMHWAAAGALLGLRDDDPDADWLGREIVRHALFLRDNLALDLRANHLFRDCVALAFAHEIAGCCPDGLALLEREVAAQILPDGAHEERAPMYHAVCLEDLVDLHVLFGERAPAWLGDAVRRAAGFLEYVLLGDGDIPLLGDGWRGEVATGPLLAQAREAAGPPIPPRAPERSSGLVRLARGSTVAVVRAGPHGPDHQLGHAHADLLSFDLSDGPRRIVTDTGTHQYAAGPARDRLRSTAAHNTIQLDGEELLEAWSSFRSGRRGRARCHARGEAAGFAWIWASHDGYAWLPGAPVHHRLLAVGERRVLVLDALLGRGRHRIESRLLLHPDTALQAVHVESLGHGPLAREPASLHERFGETRETERLVSSTEAELPWTGGFWLRLERAAHPATRVAYRAGGIEVEIADDAERLAARWNPAAASGSEAVAIEVHRLA